MIFTSLKFILFFVVCAAVYFVFPKKARWIWLLACSLFFYASAGPAHVAYILSAAAVVYLSGLILGRIDSGLRRKLAGCDGDKNRKKELKASSKRKSIVVIAVALLVMLGALWTIKYLNFSIRILSSILARFGVPFSAMEYRFLLPLGISFYIFTGIGYLIDVYRGSCDVQKNPLRLLLFLSFFPCVSQGPISRYSDLAPQLYEGHRFDYDRMTKGVQRMLWGFCEKMVLADRVGILVSGVYDSANAQSGAAYVLATLLYAVQIYADFAGYMDIACGAAYVLGIDIPENFDSPYLSRSIPEYWRRWHITLGAWFRDYLYYPVMRCPLFSSVRRKTKNSRFKKGADRIMTAVALLVVWTTTGLWHGASSTYVLWGLYHGLLITASTLLEPLTDGAVKKLGLDRERFSFKLFRTVRTFFLVCVGYVFFRSSSVSQIGTVFRSVFSRAGFYSLFDLRVTELGLDGKDLNVAIIAIALLVIVDIMRNRGVVIRDKISEQGIWLRWFIWLLGVTAVVIFGVYGPDYNAASFIYFAF